MCRTSIQIDASRPHLCLEFCHHSHLMVFYSRPIGWNFTLCTIFLLRHDHHVPWSTLRDVLYFIFCTFLFSKVDLSLFKKVYLILFLLCLMDLDGLYIRWAIIFTYFVQRVQYVIEKITVFGSRFVWIKLFQDDISIYS